MARKPAVSFSDDPPEEVTNIELVTLPEAKELVPEFGPVTVAEVVTPQVTKLILPEKVEIMQTAPTLSAQTLREMQRGAEAIGRG